VSGTPAALSPGNWLRYPLNRHVSGLRSGGLEALKNRKNPCRCQQTNPAPSVVPFVARISTAATAICHWLTYRQKSTRIHIFMLKLPRSFSDCHKPAVFTVNRSDSPQFEVPSSFPSTPLILAVVLFVLTQFLFTPLIIYTPDVSLIVSSGQSQQHLSIPFLFPSVCWLSYPSTFSKKAYLTAWPKRSTVSDL